MKQGPDLLYYLILQDLGDDDRIFTFDGRVKIHMRCDVETDTVTLHMLNITLRSYTLSDSEGNPLDIHVHTNSEYDFVEFHADTNLEVGKHYDLEIEYLGELWDGLSGFYRSSYTEGDQTK